MDASELLAAVGGGGGAGNSVEPEADMGLVLDQDAMNRLESVLQSDEGQNLLEKVASENQDGEGVVKDEEKPSVGPTRRSTRNQERETRQTAEKIKEENRRELESKKDEGKRGRGGRGRGGRGRGSSMMRGGARTRTGRETKLPAHLAEADLGEKPKEEEDEEDEDEEESDDDGSWASEDDPERLWCICKKPHNNRFMICCDTCLDWFHGKCVGITKQKGKEMEEAGQEWKCQKCVDGVSKASDGEEEPNVEDLLEDDTVEEIEATIIDDVGDAAGEDEAEEEEYMEEDEPDEEKPKTPRKRVTAAARRRSGGVAGSSSDKRRRRKSSGELPKVEKKPKTPTCHMCPNPPNQSSIYCSEHCISLHAGEALKQLGSKASGRNPVVVLEPKTNTLLNGPNAPTQATLPSWLLAHPTFHAVLGRQSSSSSFYNKEKKRDEGERKRRDSGEKLKSPVKIKKQPSFLESLQNRPIKSKEELVAETKAKLQRAMSRDGGRPTPAKKEVRRQSSNTTPAPVRRKTVPVKEPSPPPTKSSSDNRTTRKKIAHGIRDALKEKHDKCTGINLPPEKIEKIANEIEIAMFGTFGDVGSKYMNKYRSLSYNIKDSKNDGLFRRILLKDVSPIEVVGMTADEYASKELQQWREQEAKKDIEAIKTHELDMIALGNTFVMKTHKGEQVIENPDGTVPAPSSDPVVLPEEQKVEGEAREKGLSKETWKHPNHDDESTGAQCDVCSGKITLEDFVNVKVDKERGRGKRSRSRSRQRDREKHHKSHKSSHRSSKDKDSRHSSSKDKDRERHPSSKDKERHSSSKDKEKHSSSRDRHSSSKDKHVSSKDKERHRSSKDKTSVKETGSSKEKLEDKSSSSSSKEKSGTSSKDRERHRSGRKSSEKEKTESEKRTSEKEEEAARMLAEKAELQEKINRAQAAIEAARRSSGMVMPEEDLERREKNDIEESMEEPAMDLELPNMEILDEEESAPSLHRRQSGGADEVHLNTFLLSFSTVKELFF